MLRFLVAATVILAVGFWCRYEFVVKPIEVQRATRIAYYKKLAHELREIAQRYQAMDWSPEYPYYQTQARQLSAWAGWFDGRPQFLEKAPSYRKEDENRVFHAFLSDNPDFSNWMEQLENAY